jgi:hypothetical protein
MKKKYIIPGILLAGYFLSGCKKDSAEVDTSYPEIDITAASAFPKQCGTIKRGEKFIFRASFHDNVELGSSSIDIHHNFDHHTHSTEVSTCNMEPVKKPVNPFLLIKTFPIAAGQKSFTINEELVVPADADPGDYHFMIRLTDKAGWQTIKGISIKLL